MIIYSWLLLIAGAVIQYGGYKTINPFYHIENYISVAELWNYFIYYGVILIFVVLSLIFGKRASCHYICWMCPFMIMGRKVRNKIKTPALQLKVGNSKCVSCKIYEREVRSKSRGNLLLALFFMIVLALEWYCICVR